MAKQVWKSTQNAEIILERIEQIKNPSDTYAGLSYGLNNYEVKFEGKFTEYLSLLTTNTRFDDNFSQSIQKSIVRDAIFINAEKDCFDTGKISETIKKLKEKHLKLAENEYILLSTINIKYTNKFKTIRSNGIQITFTRNRPKCFEELNTNSTNIRVNKFINDNFCYVQVKITSRTPGAAFDKAREELDYIRGIWNFFYCYREGTRESFGRPDKLSHIYFGPKHTLHLPNGKLASKIYWIESNFNPESLKTKSLDKDLSDIKKIEKNIRKAINSSKLKYFYRKFLIKYASALDNENMTTAITKLWSLLEYLTITEKDETHSATVNRGAFIFVDTEYYKLLLDTLREKRNQIIHTSEQYESSENDNYLLLRVVNILFLYLIERNKDFDTLDNVKQFLSLPHNKSSIDKRIDEIHNELALIEKAKGFGIYKN